MGLAAGEVLHGGAEGIGRKQANIDLHSTARAKAYFVFATCNDVHQSRQLDDVVNKFLTFFIVTASFSSYQNVEIADGFAPSTQGTGGRNVFDPGISAQMFDDFPGLSFGRV